jgi:glycosyltransferase involved in cell wall biosynthesis
MGTRHHIATSGENAAAAIQLTSRMKILWNLRDDLQRKFDLSSVEGRAGYLAYWLAYEGAKYDGIERAVDAKSIAVAQSSVPFVEQDAALPVTYMLYGLWKALDRFWMPAFTLDDPLGRLTTTTYWYLHWPCCVPGCALFDQRAEEFLSTPIAIESQDLLLLPAELLAYRQIVTPDRLDWKQPALSGAELRCWYYLSAALDKAPHRCIIPKDMSVTTLLSHLCDLVPTALTTSRGLLGFIGVDQDNARHLVTEKLPGLLTAHAGRVRRMSDGTDAPRRSRRKLLRGANIIGYVTGELGIGEDSRTLAASLQQCRYPFSMYSYPFESAARHEDDSFIGRLRDDNPHDQNILCLPAVESMHAAIELDPEFFKGRRNIGYMPWELSKWPDRFRPVFGLLDEIWAPSSFIADSIRKASPIPVTWMPPAVVARPPGSKSRSDFGLPRDQFLFLFMFDGNSSMVRKNPIGCIDAFQRAFPADDRSVGLVFKYMNVSHDPTCFRDFIARCGADDRIHLIPGTLHRGACLDLINCCDAFLSLHRAEGFGRCIAEAMALRKPTIATAYSGNLDFCTPDTSCLVQAREVTIADGHYWYSEGQVWAEPSTDHAADCLVRLRKNREYRERIAAAGHDFILKHYSPSAAAARYLAQLYAGPL